MTSEAARIEHWDYKLEGYEAFRDAKPNIVPSCYREAGESRQAADADHPKHRWAAFSRRHQREAPRRVAAGTNSLIECQTCRQRTDPRRTLSIFGGNRKPPVCQCGGFLKPATISFGHGYESQGDQTRTGRRVEGRPLSLRLVPPSSVHPAASFPLKAAEKGAPYVIINRGETDHDTEPCVSLRLHGEVAEIFPRSVDGSIS